MIGPSTHILAGLIPLAWAVGSGLVEPSVGLILVVMGASLLPDIDSGTSVVGRLAGPVSEWIEQRVGHRTLTHSVWLAGLVTLFCWLWFPVPDAWLIAAAWLSHLIVDMIVGGRGVALFWPGPWYFFILRLKPHSMGEFVVAVCCGLVVLYPFYLPQAARRTVALAADPPTPTATPEPLVIRITHVYDPAAEILVSPGDIIHRGQLIADLATYRRYRPLDVEPPPTVPPALRYDLVPRSTQDAPPPPPFDASAAQAALAQAQAALTLAEAEYNRAMQTDSEIYDKQIAQARLDKARADYEVAILRLTPAPTATPSPTKTPTPTRTPTATRLVEDDTRIYSQVTGRVVAVRLAAISGNEATVEIDVYPDESAAPRPATATPTASVATPTATPSPTPTLTALRYDLVPRSTQDAPLPTTIPPPATPAGLVVITSTPTPATIATAAVRSGQMTAQAAQFGPPTPLPAHWVTPVIITSTPPPANEATRTYRQAAALTTGTPTPLPANAQTATPTPAQLTDPLATVPASPTPTPTPAQLPADLLGHILFRSDRESGPEAEPLLYAYDPATGQIARLSNPWPYEAARARDRWAADGSYEVYAQSLLWSNIQTEAGNVAIDELQLHIYDHVYHTERLITQMGAGLVYDPAVSPTTGQIAFVSTESGNDEIWLIEADGSVPRQLTRNDWQWDKSPSWSPDGAQIVFYSNRTGNKQLWRMAADGSDQWPLLEWTEYNDWDPVWVKTLEPPPQKARQADWRFGGE